MSWGVIGELFKCIQHIKANYSHMGGITMRYIDYVQLILTNNVTFAMYKNKM